MKYLQEMTATNIPLIKKEKGFQNIDRASLREYFMRANSSSAGLDQRRRMIFYGRRKTKPVS